ncbi:hypothetical protein GPA27_19455 [Aromatoleum toluolicum]|uniref:Uncharacterized protein n=1 Tax=Aromatoleum toluolicum TaxID=90060 RepID=A0ABX1NJQ6_9RHOO|nr:hypothetical protein [Aromatoleum toluolicum]NMF99558.1 hypothetical protein [Aromatoleum toluolicum]
MQREPLNIKFVIPAMPGFFSLSLLYDEKDQIIDACKEPVVGWAIDQYNIVCPVTPDNIDEDALATLNPDGTVQSPCGSWDSLGDWLAEQKVSRG